MKKRLLSVLICLLVCASIFAANNQKIYSVDDDIFKTISNIYLLTGHALPSTTGPWSGAELLGMMEEISINEVPAGYKDEYKEVLSILSEKPEHSWKGIGATFTNELNLEFGVHFNNKSDITRTDKDGHVERLFVGRNNWVSNYAHDLKPIYGLDWETWVQNNIYAYFNFGLYNSYHGNEENDYGVRKVSTNVFMLQNFKFEPGFMDANIPYRGFFSAGSDHWSFELGRDKLSWGAGTTGNLMMSNNLPFHNIARFTAFSDKYKYTFATSFFTHPENYVYGGGMHFITGQDGVDGISMYMAHRLEGRFCNDILGLALTEAVTYESATNHLDIVAVNPMFIFHNAYTPDIANSTLGFEFNVTPVQGLNLYGQVLVDEFAIPLIEKSAGPDYHGTPNRYGVLAGLTYATVVEDGVLKFNAEYAQIDPYTYLRHDPDYVVCVRQWSTAVPGITYDDYYLGYTYGCDSRVFSLRLDYDNGPLALFFRAMDIRKGTHDQWTKAPGYVGGEGKEAWNAKDKTCTTEAESDNIRYDYTRDAVQNTLDVGVGASYEFLDGKLTAYGQADLVVINNAFNVKANKTATDVQVVLGAKYSF